MHRSWSIRLRLVSARMLEQRTLVLVPVWRAQDPETDWIVSDHAWEAFWEGETDTYQLTPDGRSENSGNSLVQLLHAFGCVATSDFGHILRSLVTADPSESEVNAWSTQLSTLINQTTQARKQVPLP